MKNIALFDEYVAQIFADLYRAFPVKMDIDAQKLCGHIDHDEYGRVVDARGEPSKHFEIAQATAEWLYETGYIRGRELTSRGLTQAVLSPMGLAVLKAEPSSLKAGESTGDRLARLVKAGAYDAARDLVKSALTAGSAMAAGAVFGTTP